MKMKNAAVTEEKAVVSIILRLSATIFNSSNILILDKEKVRNISFPNDNFVKENKQSKPPWLYVKSN